MIELTKQQFDGFLNEFHIDNKLSCLIITRQIVNPGPNRIATLPLTTDDFGGIYVFTESNFKYTNPTVNNLFASIGNGIENDGNGIVLNSQASQQTMYVIYVTSDTSFNGRTLFTNVDLVSVDYVGQDVRILSFPSSYSNLEEINLYPSSRNGITDLYSGISIADGQNIYNGVNYDFELSPGAFKGSKIKKLLLPPGINIPNELCADCTDLLEVVCEGTFNIGKNAFKGCTNLQSFYNQTSVTTMGDGAFDGCVNLKDIHIPYGDPTGTTTQYFGLRGCIMKHEMVNGSVKLSIVFANNWWWDGVKNHITECGFVQSYMAYLTNKLYPGTYTSDNLPTMVNMIYTDGTGTLVGTLVVDDFINSGYGTNQGLLVTSSNIGQLPDRVGGSFLIPLCWFVDEIMPNACAGDTNITSVDLSNFYCLTNIGNGAFKGCTGITEINLGDNSFSLMAIGVSAFEKCTGFNSLNITRRLTLSDKSFFGCSNLEYLNFGDFASTMNNSSNPSLVFGNTPSLASITANSDSGQIAYYNGTPLNAILAGVNQQDHQADRILVGCKNTDFDTIRTQYSCTKIGAGAFYGCTSLVINGSHQMLNGYTQVLDSAFYGCTGIVSNNNSKVIFKTLSVIGPNAFYGCTNLETLDLTTGNGGAGYIQIGTKAFANSGVKHITVGTVPYIQTIADDTFENCVLSDVNVGDSSYSILRDSIDTTENSLLKRTTSGGSVVAMLKSGNGKDIVNTDYNGKTISEIKSNAFTGVTMASGNNTTIHIPASVLTLGKEIMSKSKLNASNGTGSLVLEGNSTTKNNCVVCDGHSIALLYMVGGKYFKRLVEDTLDNKSHNLTHYYVNGITDGLEIYEHNGKGPDVKVMSVQYNNGDMVLSINAVPFLDYDAPDDDTHVTPLANAIDLTLMYFGQKYNENEVQVYREGGLTPGSIWSGIGGEIEDDLEFVTKSEYPAYGTSQGGSFSNCTWIKAVTSKRNLSGLIDGFAGDTSLISLRAEGIVENDIDYNLFDGEVPSGMFSECTSFSAISASTNGMKVIYPIKYNKKAFYKCKNLDKYTTDSLKLATVFGEESFAETNLNTIDLMSAIDIHETAFKGCNNLTSARATNTTGNFFTGAGGDCIVNDGGIIVVGTPAVVVGTEVGVGNYAFYGRTKGSAWSVLPLDKTGFTIGKSAFSTSDITQYVENGCKLTVVLEEAFAKCLSLTRVELTGNDGATLNKKAFAGCTALINLALPKGTRIPEAAFSTCTSLPNVTVSGNVDKDAFEKCSSLTIVNFYYDANSIQTIDPTAFVLCPIASFRFNDGVSGVTSSYTFTQNTVSRWNTEGHLELVLGTTNFASYTEMPNFKNLKIIGDHAYNGRGLTGEITIPGSVTKIGDYAFANNPGITKVHIPPTVEYIGDHAFDGCTNLKRLVLPDEICYIGEAVLKGCNLSEGLNCNYEDFRNFDTNTRPSIGGEVPRILTFNSTIDLRNTPFTSISANAFENTQIKAIHLPAGCTSIGNSAFSGCAYLSAVYYYNGYLNPMTLQASIFYGCQYLSDFYLCGSGYPTVTDSDYTFYGVGSAVAPGNKHIHITQTLDTNEFRNSAFCTKLVGTLGFTVVVDVDL